MTLTKRDKRLLCILGVILMVVVFGNFIIIPQWEKRQDLSMQLSEKQEQQKKMQDSILNLNQKKATLASLSQSFSGDTRDYYKLEESHAMERKITKIFLSCGLNVKDFNITDEPQVSVMVPYIFSSLAKSDGAKTGTDDASSGTSSSATTATAGDSTTTVTETQASAIKQSVMYSYTISVLAQGSDTNMKKMIDKIYRDYPAIRITGYTMNAQAGVNTSNQVIETTGLSLNMEVYMVDK